jgi:hypothetical protein
MKCRSRRNKRRQDDTSKECNEKVSLRTTKTLLRTDDVKRRAYYLPSHIGPSLPLGAHQCRFKVNSPTSGNSGSYTGHRGPRDAKC